MREGRLRFREPGLIGNRYAIGQFVFVPDEGEDIVPNFGAVSLYCGGCDTVVALGAYQNEKLTCFRCNQVIAEGLDSCPECGWTWK
jgi:hypothetical protein